MERQKSLPSSNRAPNKRSSKKTKAAIARNNELKRRKCNNLYQIQWNYDPDVNKCMCFR